MTTMPMMSKQQWDSILWSYFLLTQSVDPCARNFPFAKKELVGEVWVQHGQGIWTLELMDMQEWIDWRNYSELLLLDTGALILAAQTDAFIGELTLHWKYVSNWC
jgi:hypothetical protein